MVTRGKDPRPTPNHRNTSTSDIHIDFERSTVVEKTTTTTTTTPILLSESQPPLVVVQGFLCSPSSAVWGDFQRWFETGQAAERAASGRATKQRLAKRKILFPRIGPVSSLHDRACELFYALRGGATDYGAAHAELHGHARYGRTTMSSEALYPQWSPSKPVHFLTHSLGGPTVLKLQQLLREGFFDEALAGEQLGSHAAHEAILSITCVSAPFHGTPLVYLLGSQPSPRPEVRFLSAGDILAKAVHMVVFIETHLPTALANPLRKLLDPHADAWPFAQKRSNSTGSDSSTSSGSSTSPVSRLAEALPTALWDLTDGLGRLAAQLRHSQWAEGSDCAPWDCTLHAREQDALTNGWALDTRERHRRHTLSNANANANSGRTYYRSLATYMTQASGHDVPHHSPAPTFLAHLSPLALASWLLGTYDFSKLEPRPSWFGKGAARPARASSAQDKGEGDEGAIRGMEAWYANDGVVPLLSQFHPSTCHPRNCTHTTHLPGSKTLRRVRDAAKTSVPRRTVDRPAMDADEKHPAATLQQRWTETLVGPLRTLIDFVSPSPPVHDEEKGPHPAHPVDKTAHAPLSPDHWYTHQIAHTTHASLMPLWMGSEAQKSFWIGMGEWCVRVEETEMTRRAQV